LKIHFPESRLEVRWHAIDHNIGELKKRAANRKLLAVVKCDAYSHGAVAVSQHIEPFVDWFAVATVDEGIELRLSGIRKPILIFGVPDQRNAASYLTHNLTATISHLSHFSVLMDGTEYHLNFDTGMGRLGLKPGEADEVKKVAIANQRLSCSGIYSHFATADDPGSDFVETQHQRFVELRQIFREVPIAHMSNTGAVANYPELEHFDMVRSGLGILGYNSGHTRYDWLQPVSSWKSHVVQVRPIKKGEPVSYSSTWECPEDGYLATLPVGYADGIPRSISNRLKVNIGNKVYPQVGNVTMDYIMVYTGEERVAVEAEAILFGDGSLTAADWAERAQTNVHEILTNIHEKVAKRYLDSTTSD
jgi:alanine racemase